MNLSFPANSSPGSSVFDFPAHTEVVHAANELRVHTRPSPSLATHPDDSCSFVVISGGTGCNPICSAFGPNACYVLPISDDGGSSSEIIRVLGGPSIGVCHHPISRLTRSVHTTSVIQLGDIRSRLIRLIPPVDKGSPLDAIRTLLAHRLSSDGSEKDAREEWRDVVEGRSSLWAGIPSDRKEMIRGERSTQGFGIISYQPAPYQDFSFTLRASYSSEPIRTSHSRTEGNIAHANTNARMMYRNV